MFLFLSLLLLLPLEETQSYPDCSCCDEMGIHIYEEMGCEAVTKDHYVCPDYYKCPEFETGHDFCMFAGKYYKIGEKLNGTSNCKVCECKRILVDGKISAGIKCLPKGGCPNFKTKDCTNKYDLDKCCPVGSRCSLPERHDCDCKVDGHCYQDGERFVPKDSCHECVCRKDFTGDYVEPFCRRRRCDVEANYPKEIRANCAPVYDRPVDREAMCCPHRFICPGNDCKVEEVHMGHTNCQTCYFGDQEFARNTSIHIHEKMLKGTNTVLCTCATPPLMTCIE